MESCLQQATIVDFSRNRSELGQFSGTAKATFSNGQQYEGTWQQGHMEGQGSITFPDGIKYEGSFVCDTITGNGMYMWGDVVYNGDVLNGQRHGFGVLTFRNSPARYEGYWQHGKRHGKGTLYYDAEGLSYYSGDWEDDMKHGQGTSMYKGGNSYIGAWWQDMRHGQGTMTWATTGQLYSGQWVRNLPNGLGQHLWHCSLQAAKHASNFMFNRYVGMFRDGRRHGEGALWYSSGARYEGQWDTDKKQGQGAYMFEDGTVFLGQFAADKPLLEQGCITGADASLAELHPAGCGASCRVISAPCTSTPSDAGANTPDARRASAGGSTAASAAANPPGFGPRVACLQLYIVDLLADCQAPCATYKTVSNLLIGYNSDLRALYDKYSCHWSPVINLDISRSSWALQCGQLWELVRDAQILCRHLQLVHVCQATLQALQPPPAIQQRRQQVLATADAAAVVHSVQHLADPTTELLYRDFCELLVRLAPLRYPRLPSLEQQLQQLIAYHLLPLLGPNTGRLSAARSSVIVERLTSSSAAGSGGPGSNFSAGNPTCMARSQLVGAEQLQQADLVIYLQSQIEPLQEVFAAMMPAIGVTPGEAASVGPKEHVAAGCCTVERDMPRAAPQLNEIRPVHRREWLDQHITVRQVVQRLQQAAVLQQWQISPEDVAAALLDGWLSVADPEGPRARVEDIGTEPDDLDQQQQQQAISSQAAAAAATSRELLFWLDCPMLHVELVWGFVRCAALLPVHHLPPPQQQFPAQQQEQQQQQPQQAHQLIIRLQQLLQGSSGLFSVLLCKAAGAGSVLKEQHQEQQQVQEHGHQQEYGPTDNSSSTLCCSPDTTGKLWGPISSMLPVIEEHQEGDANIAEEATSEGV